MIQLGSKQYIHVTEPEYHDAHINMALGWSRRTSLYLKYFLRYLIGR